MLIMLMFNTKFCCMLTAMYFQTRMLVSVLYAKYGDYGNSKHSHLLRTSPGLTAALDRTKLMDRRATFVLTEAARSFGLDVSDMNINRSSIQRHRQQQRRQVARCLKS